MIGIFLPTQNCYNLSAKVEDILKQFVSDKLQTETELLCKTFLQNIALDREHGLGKFQYFNPTRVDVLQCISINNKKITLFGGSIKPSFKATSLSTVGGGIASHK